MFDSTLLIGTLKTLQDRETARTLPSDTISFTCREIARLMPLLGPALHFASWDVNSKLDTLQRYIDNMGNSHSLRSMMLSELQIHRTHCSYTAPPLTLTRTVQRLMWMLDFVQGLLACLATDESESVQSAATQVYNERLRDHHRWLVQKAVLLALRACPLRATLDAQLSREQQNTLAALLRAPVAALAAFFNEQQLGDVQ